MVTSYGTIRLLPESVLTDNSVHVWSASLQQTARVIQGLSAVLSDDERTRAERFHFKEHRNYYIVGRGILRFLLARYLHLEPQQLQVEYTQYGKPFLADSHGAQTLCFNLSHSGGYVMYAFSRNRRVGIDIEHIHALADMEQIAATNFSKDENRQFKTVGVDEKQQAFFNCWTRKEAFIKAIGDGLSFPLAQFDVSLIPGEPARLLGLLGSEQEAARWCMCELRPAVGYVAALVIEGNGCSISYQEWTPPEFMNTGEEPK